MSGTKSPFDGFSFDNLAHPYQTPARKNSTVSNTSSGRKASVAQAYDSRCCSCNGMIVISVTCTGCGHKQCTSCPAC